MFSCTPSVFLSEGAEIIKIMHLYHQGRPQNQQMPQAEGGDEYA